MSTSGEEAYTLRLLWAYDVGPRVPNAALHVTATDTQAHMLERARRGCYPRGTLKDLPDAWVEQAFTRRSTDEEPYCIRSAYRHGIEWRQQDIREAMPDGLFHLICCRNLVFTYFDERLQRACLRRMLDRLLPDGLLLLGKHETLPDGDWPLTAWDAHKRIYRRTETED